MALSQYILSVICRGYGARTMHTGKFVCTFELHACTASKAGVSVFSSILNITIRYITIATHGRVFHGCSRATPLGNLC